MSVVICNGNFKLKLVIWDTATLKLMLSRITASQFHLGAVVDIPQVRLDADKEAE